LWVGGGFFSFNRNGRRNEDSLPKAGVPLESLIVLLLVIGTSIWVGIDAGNLGMRRGRVGGGMLDMSVAAWVVCCLLVWISPTSPQPTSVEP
jgi:hypothetical protein